MSDQGFRARPLDENVTRRGKCVVFGDIIAGSCRFHIVLISNLVSV